MVNFVYNTEEITNNQLKPKDQFFPFEIDDKFVTCNKFVFDGSVNPEELANRMIETAKKYKSYSCCSNQIGFKDSVFVAGYGEEFVAFFNPIILDYNGEETLAKESDNISFPGLVLNIKRYSSVTVEYQDYLGQVHVQTFDGLTSRIIQQCCDRLQGIGINRVVSKLQLERANKALNKKVKFVVRHQMNQLRIKQ